MLSENLQHRIRGDEASKTSVPHGTQVLAGRLFDVNRKLRVIAPCRLTIRCQTRCEGSSVFGVARLNGKRQVPHGRHPGWFTLPRQARDGLRVHARSSWQLPAQ